MSAPRKFLVALHNSEASLSATITNQLGLGADSKDMSPIHVSPGTPIRELSPIDESDDETTELKRVDSRKMEIGTGSNQYTVIQVGTYPEGSNTLKNAGKEALRALKVELDKIQENEAIHLLLEFNFGYTGQSVAIALVVKDYLEQKLKGNAHSIKMTLQGSGGQVKNKESIIADINEVFGIDISANQAKYFVENREAVEKVIPKYNPKQNQGITLEVGMVTALKTIPGLVGKGPAERRKSRARSFRSSRSSTPTPMDTGDGASSAVLSSSSSSAMIAASLPSLASSASVSVSSSASSVQVASAVPPSITAFSMMSQSSNTAPATSSSSAAPSETYITHYQV